jgi:hypothetical protein
MTSFGIGSIYIHPTTPGEAADVLNIPNPSQALFELSLTPLFVRVSD